MSVNVNILKISFPRESHPDKIPDNRRRGIYRKYILVVTGNVSLDNSNEHFCIYSNSPRTLSTSKHIYGLKDGKKDGKLY